MVKDSRTLDDFLSFDKILLDAPCSGSGTININDNKLEKYFTEDLVNRSTKIQFNLLKKAITLLKPGHEMIYSTCSILAKENEEILQHFIKSNKVEIIHIDLNDICFVDNTAVQAKWVDLRELYNMIENGEIAWVLIPRIEEYVIPLMKETN